MEIPPTAELHADSDCEAGTELERARVGDALVNTEAHLLFVVRVVREHLLRDRNWGRGDDLASIELVFDLIDLHVLPPEVEELVWVEVTGGVVRERGIMGRARVQGQARCRGDEAEVARVLTRSRLDLEPAMDECCASAAELSLMRKSRGLTCHHTLRRRRYAPRWVLRCGKRGPCR